jgi:hypothetical protein
MYKRIIQIKKKAGLSRADFIDYYENHHEPLIRRLIGINSTYRRNYLLFDDPMLNVGGFGGSREQAGFDVLTERVFGSRAESEAVMKAYANPDIFAQLKADEAQFIEPDGIKAYSVEVYMSRYP